MGSLGINLSEQWGAVAGMVNDPGIEADASLARDRKKRKDQYEIDLDLRRGVKSNGARNDAQGNGNQKSSSALMQDALRQQMLRLQINGKEFNISIGQLDEDAKDRLKNLDKEAEELQAKGDTKGYEKKIKAKTAWQEYTWLRENGGSPSQLQEAMENVIKYDAKYAESLSQRENDKNLKASSIKGGDKYDMTARNDFNKVALSKSETSIYALLQADEPYSKELAQKAQKHLEKGEDAGYRSTMNTAGEWNEAKSAFSDPQDLQAEANVRIVQATEQLVEPSQRTDQPNTEGAASNAVPSKVFSF